MEDDRPGTTSPDQSPLAEETNAVESRADWRASVEASLIATAVIGVWLIISAFAFSYEKPASALIWGVVVIVLAALRLIGDLRSATLAFVTLATGALIVLTAFVLDDKPGPTANMALMGLAIVVLQVISLGAASENRRTSRY